ncbi:PAS domain S-box protein [Marinobacterium lutimaris]|uniref:Sensor protein FixL n=1 Tax=Marinobacterium lutimaris TaxID=568106 RepID=A0A1H5YW31_9GAMM|nr:PAS domain S-box protein [Marinobacterium lutimaris]SEG27687.1 PAS domain S-box-containing protein [Marinobacterium lutimaris]
MLSATLALNCLKNARRDASRKVKVTQVIAGSIALGGGTWSMHFIGMLAYELPIDVVYSFSGTVLSALPVFFASLLSLSLLTLKRTGSAIILSTGTLLGLGIGVMHYSGMMAMKVEARMVYDLFGVLLSVLVAAGMAIFAIWLGSRQKPILQRPLHDVILRGCIMGSAIASMHYVGMGAVTFYTAGHIIDAPLVTHPIFAMLIAIGTLSIITSVITTNTLVRYKQLRVENEIRKHRLEAVLETAVDGIVTIDSRGLIESMNPAAEQMLGWKIDEVAGQNVSLLMPAPYKEAHDGYLSNYLKSKDAKIIGSGREVMAKHRDGHLIPIRLGVGEVELDGQPPLFVGFITDISEQRRMQSALRESEHQFRTLLGNMPGVAFRCLTDNPWTMMFISDAVEELTGWPPEEFINGRKHMAQLICEDDMELCERTVSEAIQNRSSYSVEYRIRHRDGSQRWVLDSGDFEFVDDRAKWIDGVLLDITERRNMEDELRYSKQAAEDAAQAKAAFLANMSHEIRTPMNAIIGFSDVMREGKLEPEQKRYIDSISNAARSLLYLLNDILDSAKLERGKLTLDVIDFSLHELLDSLVSTYWLTARKKGLDLKLTLDPALGDYFQGAPDRIRQVLTNLLGNAIKFTEAGSVELKALRNAQGRIEFNVIDSGIGMSQQAVESIFEPFTQADASMSRRFGGTGLGTTISKQLVELMGGEISVTSQEGQGTEFRVTLPLTPGMKPERPVTQASSSEIVLPNLNILIADDISQNLELLELVLGRDGHKVTRARDGLEALEKINAQKFDLVLMDVQMPKMDGLTAARRIREKEAAEGLPTLPIIALTASVLEADKQAARAAGMNGFAQKPVEPQNLKTEIARVITGKTSVQMPVTAQTAYRQLINLERALELWGDEARYIEQLALFLDKKHEKILREALSNNNFDELRQLAHAASGVSGNLAMIRVSRLFRQLETCAETHDPGDCETLLSDLGALLQRAKSELGELEANQPEISTEATQSERCDRAFNEALIKAQRLCEHGEIDDDIIAQMQEHCPDELCPTVAELAQALEDFDFRHASVLLNQIAGTSEETPA